MVQPGQYARPAVGAGTGEARTTGSASEDVGRQDKPTEQSEPTDHADSVEHVHRVGDTALVRIVRCRPASASAVGSVDRAAAELHDRHGAALLRFAALCAATPHASDELAGEASRNAVRDASALSEPAWRPHLLTTVLSVAGSWLRSGRGADLGPDLRTALENPGEGGGPALILEAFTALPAQTQTLLWHDTVEDEPLPEILRYLGATGADLPPGSLENARAAFRAAYVRAYEEQALGDCRHFRRIVVASARLSDHPVDGHLKSHLTQCPGACSRAYDDLRRMLGRHDILLAEGVLAWGGARYIAERLAAGDRRGGTDALRSAAPDRKRRARRLAAVGALVCLAVAAPATIVAFTASEPADPPVAGGALVPGAAGGSLLPSAPASKPASPSASPSSSASPSATTGHPARPSTSPSRKPPKPTPPVVSGAAVSWSWRGTTGATTADTSGNGNTGVLVNGPTPDSGGALRFDGRSQYVESVRPAVDTNQSFSVAAWVNLGSKGDFHTALSQDGDRISGFFLQYDPRVDRWTMAIRDDDSTRADKDQAESVTRPAVGAWTHLTGVYDDAEDEIRLYVNGVLEDTAKHSGDWGASGNFVAGRAKWNGGDADRFSGLIGDVRAFPRVLSDAEAVTLAKVPPR
ncbi:LamG-like jellyroll fold domain-containing protein [Streptomyces sp. NPDC127084]|uniref:LamG-like jellyroll fold domain-containing protein n=1 Tax=Streptomyces sp. NPDC127084 TaxID=3347133 RepID=UPI00364F578C